MNFTLATAATILMFLIFGIIFVLLSLKDKMIKTICITIGLILSVIVAVPVTRVILDCCVGLGTNEIIKFVPTDIGDVLSNMPEVLDSVIRMIASPLVFLLVFIIAMVFMGIAVIIVGKYVKLKQKKLPFRLVAIVFALINAAIVVSVILLPVSAYSHVITLTVDAATEENISAGKTENETQCTEAGEQTEEDTDTLSEILKALNLEAFENTVQKIVGYTRMVDNDVVVKTLYTKLSGPVYDEMCTVRFEGKAFKFTDEIKPVLKVTGKILNLMNEGDLTNLSSEKIDKFEELTDDCEDSAVISIVLTEFIGNASSKWLNGEKFMGQERPVIDEIIDPTLTEILKIFSTCDRDNFRDDLYTILEVARIMLDSGLLDNLNDYSKMLEVIGGGDDDEGIIEKVKNRLNENERMAALSAEIDRLSVRALCSVLNSVENNEQYIQVKSDIANALCNNLDPNDPESVKQFKEDIRSTIENVDIGVQVPDAAIDKVAEVIMTNEQFVGRDDVTPEEVEEFLLDYAVSGEIIDDIGGEGEGEGGFDIGDIIDEIESGSINPDDIEDIIGGQ